MSFHRQPKKIGRLFEGRNQLFGQPSSHVQILLHDFFFAGQIPPPIPINLHRWACSAHHKKDILFVELTLKNLNKNVDM